MEIIMEMKGIDYNYPGLGIISKRTNDSLAGNTRAPITLPLLGAYGIHGVTNCIIAVIIICFCAHTFGLNATSSTITGLGMNQRK